MDNVFLLIAVAVGIGLIVLMAREAWTRSSLRGKDHAVPESSGDGADSFLLTSILDGNSSHDSAVHGDASHHGACDSGGHDSGGFDCGSHGGFDGSSHH